MVALRFSLKLKEGKSPHVYLIQLKKLMESDTSLHPMMKRTLKLLKKTRTPFIMLPIKKEMVIDGDNFRHFDRSAEPNAGAWIVTYWSPDEIEQYKQSPQGHLRAFMTMMDGLGYEFYDSVRCSQEYITTLESLCSKQIEAQTEARKEVK